MEDAIKCIERNKTGIAIVADENGRLIQTIVDGDIRRALLAHLPLDTPINKVLSVKRDPQFKKPLTVKPNATYDDAEKIMLEKGIQQIPIVDDANCVVGIYTLRDILNKQSNLTVAIMAGGFGKRLKPLTNITPKPMLPVGGKPLLSLQIEKLQKAGVKHITIIVHYKAEMIMEYFKDGSDFGVQIEYIVENEPRGTAGSLSEITNWNGPKLILNADILVELNLKNLLNFHIANNTDMTLTVRNHIVSIPFGVIENDGHHVTKLDEKPTYQYNINSGIYLINPSIQKLIPKFGHFDMSDLIEISLCNSKTVVSYPISGFWSDIGMHSDYEEIHTLFSQEKPKFRF